jgi:hypothetical protein
MVLGQELLTLLSAAAPLLGRRDAQPATIDREPHHQEAAAAKAATSTDITSQMLVEKLPPRLLKLLLLR